MQRRRCWNVQVCRPECINHRSDRRGRVCQTVCRLGLSACRSNSLDQRYGRRSTLGDALVGDLRDPWRRGGIRTPDTVARMPHFECGAFNHSATSPLGQAEIRNPRGAGAVIVERGGGNKREPTSLPASPPRRLVKRALPSPVPIVSTPQCFTSCMNGTSLRPCTTASLCIRIVTSWSSIDGIASARRAGRLKRLLSQLPGRFCAPLAMLPSSSILPGQRDADERRQLVALPCWRA